MKTQPGEANMRSLSRRAYDSSVCDSNVGKEREGEQCRSACRSRALRHCDNERSIWESPRRERAVRSSNPWRRVRMQEAEARLVHIPVALLGEFGRAALRSALGHFKGLEFRLIIWSASRIDKARVPCKRFYSRRQWMLLVLTTGQKRRPPPIADDRRATLLSRNISPHGPIICWRRSILHCGVD